MAKPLIGITSNYSPPEVMFGRFAVSDAYIAAVKQAGGLPVILPGGLAQEDTTELFARLDGILLTGGADVDPQRFGGLPHERVYGIDEGRDALEIQLTQMALAAGKPFFGICRGIQVVNVALGGTLYTDIGDQKAGALRHDWYPDIPLDHLAHHVSVRAGSRLAELLGGEDSEVNSLHHQAILQLAPALTAVAFSPDDLVEGVEIPGHPFAMAVQWHPELLQKYAPQRCLFESFINAARLNSTRA